MKRKFFTPCFTAGLMFIGLSAQCLAADIPESIAINLQASNPEVSAAFKDSKTVPSFSHAKHALTIVKTNNTHSAQNYDEKFTCTLCHAGVKNAEDIGSSDAKARQAVEVNKAGSVKKYMHGLCLDCHKSMKKENLATGPTSCAGCHNPK